MSTARVTQILIIPSLGPTDPAYLRIDFDDDWHISVPLGAGDPMVLAESLHYAAALIEKKARSDEPNPAIPAASREKL